MVAVGLSAEERQDATRRRWLYAQCLQRMGKRWINYSGEDSGLYSTSRHWIRDAIRELT